MTSSRTIKNNYDLAKAMYSVYHLSLDLKQNQSDNLFCANEENRIVYFVDANVVNVFVSPYQDGMLGDFGGLIGRSGVRPIVWMLCTEYIFSEWLLGNRDKKLYVTAQHRNEIAWNFLHIHRNCMRRLVTVGKSAKKTEQRLKIQEKLQVEKKHLQAKENLIENKFKELAELLACDDKIEPLEQMSRIFSEGALSGPEKDFGFPAGIDYEYLKWKEIFDSEMKGWPFRKESSKKHDAESIAYMQWVADKRLNENNRLVFVTADIALANLYRKWFFSPELHDGCPPKNYIIRLISQYLPQINLSNAKALPPEQKDALELFSKIQATVEISLMPVMIRSLGADRLLLSEKIFEKIADDQDLTESFDEALTHLADIEERSIYYFGSYLKNRMPASLRNDLSNLSDAKAVERIKASFQQTIAESIAALITAAGKSVSMIELAGWSRIPKTLHFPIGPSSHLSAKIFEFIDKGHVPDGFFRGMMPHAIYAVCAGLALAYHQNPKSRRHAIWYAELCQRHCAAHLKDGRKDSLLFEANFLCALINRFILGAQVRLELAERSYRSARKYIDLNSEIEGLKIKKNDLVRLKAEEAALSLFMATQYLIHEYYGEAESTLALAQKKLNECRRESGLFTGGDKSAQEERRHFSHNLASLAILQKVCFGEHSEQFSDPEMASSVRSMLEYLSKEKSKDFASSKDAEERKNKDPLCFLQAELHCFLAFSHNDAEQGQKAFDLCGQVEPKSLVIDFWQAERMKEGLLEYGLALCMPPVVGDSQAED